MTFTNYAAGGTIPNGQIELDGIRYWSLPVKEIRFEWGGIIIEFEGREPVNKCDHCGRADWRPRLASSWEDAIRSGWVIRVCTWEDVSTSGDRAADQMAVRFECGQLGIFTRTRLWQRHATLPAGMFLSHECRLEQIPDDPTSVRVIGVRDGS